MSLLFKNYSLTNLKYEPFLKLEYKEGNEIK